MSNTSILIKRSSTTSRPASLASGELAYSYLSNTFFVGSPSGTGVINVGGQYYTSTIDGATASNTVSTLVKRDINGAFSGNLLGSSTNTYSLINAQNFSISGGDITASAISFNGTDNVALSASLNSVTGLTAGVYGGATAIPVVTVAANGRIMAISNTSISTSFTVAGNTGSGTQAGGGTLTIQGGNTGITTTVTGAAGSETVTIDTDNTVLRSNVSSVGTQTIGTDLYVSGNLYISGTQTYVNTSIVQTTDSILVLAANNVGDVIDIGFVGRYGTDSGLSTGLVRDAGNKAYYLFAGVNSTSIGSANTIANNLFTAANTATLYSNLNAVTANITNAGITTANVTGATIDNLILTNALPIASGGTNNTTFNPGSITYFDGTKLNNLANTGTSGTYADAATVPVITTDAYGRVSSVTNTAIAIDASQITSGTLGVTRGGTGVSTFAAGQIVVGDGTNGLKQIANSSYTLTGSLGAAKTITSLTVDAYGRVTAATASDISGLTVSQGGTGASTLSAGGLLVGNGTGAISTLANTTYTLTGTLSAAKTITSFTVDAYGRVTAATASDISGLTVTQGGTGASTFTTNGIVYGSGTNAMGVTDAVGTSDQTWSNQILTVTNAGVPVWSSALDGGQF